jgi:hypothetical protein
LMALRWGMILSPSPLDLEVPLSVHPAPDILGFLSPVSTSRIPSRVIVGRSGVTSEFDGRDFHPHQEDSSAL